jgi:hypothetical protein
VKGQAGSGLLGPAVAFLEKGRGSNPQKREKGKDMKAFVLFASVGVVSSAASAGVVTSINFTSLKEWESAAELAGPSMVTVFDDLTGFVPGVTTESLSGGSSWTSWTISAEGGVRAGKSFITSAVAGQSLVFDFTGSTFAKNGLYGIGGNFGFRDESGNFQPGEIVLTLSTGESIFQTFSSKTDFAGFWLTDPAVTITGMRLQPISGSNLAAYSVSVDNLYFGGVPAPGALALLGVAGICTAKRRR